MLENNINNNYTNNMNNNDSNTNNSLKEVTDNQHICIIGTLDCPKVTMCRQIIEDLKKRDIASAKFEFILAFETPFEQHREELFKEDLEFLKYKSSPIIYSKVYTIIKLYNIL